MCLKYFELFAKEQFILGLSTIWTIAGQYITDHNSCMKKPSRLESTT